MERQIIAGKYPLIKPKGYNGLATTYLAEDPYSGDPVVIKVFSEENPLAVEYIKAINLLADGGCSTLLMPLEGGVLEYEPGYYLVFPEIPGPTLEEFLRIGGPLGESERNRIAGELKDALNSLHKCGFVHLFLSPRNIFYSPGSPVYVKDPALKPVFFPFILQRIKGFDYGYFSPSLMDGSEGGPEDDFFSLNRVLEQVSKRVHEFSKERVGAGRTGIWNGLCHDEMEEISLKCGDAFDLAGDAQGRDFNWSGRRDGLVGATCREGLSGITDLRSMIGETMEEVSGEGNISKKRVAGKYFKLGAAMMILLSIWLALHGIRPERGGVSLEAGQVTEASQAWVAEATGFQEGGEEAVADQEGPQFLNDATGSGQQAAAGSAAPSAVGGSPSPASQPAEKQNQRPVASFAVSPGEGSSPLRVYLDASASYDPDGNIISYAWSFGGNGRTLYHIFESNIIPARIAITLTVTDNLGASSSATRYVTLY